MSNLLSIKLQRPAPPPKYVQRPDLNRRLDEGLALGRPLTLVSAPAGFGKTTCISAWLAEAEVPSAWLTLNAEDNDPGRFFSYLVAAHQQIQGIPQSSVPFPRLHEVESVLRSGQIPPVEVIASAWVTDILAYPGRFLLVLDDFHLIQDRFILEVFEKLFVYLFQSNQPQPAHLILLTREDPPLPLARLRANDRLTELRAQELRFPPDESKVFLNSLMGLTLSEPDMAVLEERMEGWIAGLQLAGISMRDRADKSAFIRSLSGSQRFILNYLVEEVLSQQPADVQQFLLDTSIVERLNGDLCGALTGRAGSAELLEQLYRANLFILPLDDDRRWYRYHPLFRDLLRSRLAAVQGERIPELHQRAGRWFAQTVQQNTTGESAPLIIQAVRHFLAAADYAAVVQSIETHASEMLSQWYVSTLQDWLEALPPEWSARSPKTNLAFARLFLLRGDLARAAPYIARLEALFSAEQAVDAGERSPELRAEWMALQASLLIARGLPEPALAVARQALEILPEENPDIHSRIYLVLASASQYLGDTTAAEEYYQHIIQIGRFAADPLSELLGISALALMAIERGQLHYAHDLALQGVERMQRAGILPPIAAGLFGELGQIAYHWGRFQEAEEYFQRAVQASVLAGFSDAEIFYAVTRSRIHQMRGDLDKAEQEIKVAVQAMHADAPLVVREEVVAQQVNIFLLRRDLHAAEQAVALLTVSSPAGETTTLASIHDLSSKLEIEQTISYPQGVLNNCALRIWLYTTRWNSLPALVPESIDVAGRLLAVFMHRQFLPLAVETILLRAQLHALLGNQQAVQSDLAQALDLAEPERLISLFIMEGAPVAEALLRLRDRTPRASSRAVFIQQILDAFASLQADAPSDDGTPQPGITAEQFESLTQRELEVLRLMKEGRTYAEIAGSLVVSINTVRSHVKSIYGKLGVNNRTAALASANQLKLI